MSSKMNGVALTIRVGGEEEAFRGAICAAEMNAALNNFMRDRGMMRDFRRQIDAEAAEYRCLKKKRGEQTDGR
jgi:hypothetical protein